MGQKLSAAKKKPSAVIRSTSRRKANPTQKIDCEVVHEEIIVHFDAERKHGRLRCTARVMGLVVMDGQEYNFERVIALDLKKGKPNAEN